MIPFDVRRRLHKEPIDLSLAFNCPAITRCCEAWYRAFQSADARNLGRVSVWLRANEAYRNAMPPLNTPENIRDFVACLTHGMIINAISHPYSAQLLKAATLAANIARDMSKLAGARAPKRSSAEEDQVPAAPASTEGCETVEWSLDI